jgi:hypothetical protein
MDLESRELAERAAESRDIKELILNYNCQKMMVADYRSPDNPFRNVDKYPAWGSAKVDDHADWHEHVLALLADKLSFEGLFVTLPSFWDGATFEAPGAPGLFFEKTSDKTFRLVSDPYNMEEDLVNNDEIKTLVQDDTFAQNLYAAMCNVGWLKNGIEWSCSWRYSGGLVAELRDKDEDYMDYYCSGIHDGSSTNVSEGQVSDAVRTALAKLSWTPNEKDLGKI